MPRKHTEQSRFLVSKISTFAIVQGSLGKRPNTPKPSQSRCQDPWNKFINPRRSGLVCRKSNASWGPSWQTTSSSICESQFSQPQRTVIPQFWMVTCTLSVGATPDGIRTYGQLQQKLCNVGMVIDMANGDGKRACE